MNRTCLLFTFNTLLGCMTLFASNSPARSGPAGEAWCERQVAGHLPDGREIPAYTLRNARGFSATVMALGATLTELRVPDPRGVAANVVLGLDRFDAYQARPSYLGAVIGRVANRIAGSQFTLDDQVYHLNANNGGTNHLHGGPRGFDKFVWQSQALPATPDGIAVEFSLLSPEGDEHYPGNLQVTVTYTLAPTDVLRIEYRATTDRATPVNLTNHTFFNLAGTGDILGHQLEVNAARYTPQDAAKLPTGVIAPVAGTAFDFTTPHALGERIGGQGAAAVGYDLNYVLNGASGRLDFCARLADPVSGRVLEVWTTEPGVQLNTGNGFDGRFTGRDGQPIRRYAGCAFETQHFPDAVNHPQFPSIILRPGETYRSTTEFRFPHAP